MGLHRRYERLLAANGIELAGGDDPLTGPQREQLEARFHRMMKTLFREEGAHLRLEIMGEDSVQDFITEHAAALDSAFENVEMSNTMRENLRHSDWMFSGLKTFHELKEAFPSLLDENGRRKPFERFLNDVQKVDETYNRHYLRAEYNFANASASMASRWESFTDDNERFRLQYRTQNDGSVRPEHQALHGVTLPKDDPFWDSCYPPLGWNCRCTVVEVPAEDYPTTPRNEAENRATEAMAKDKKGMFRFNSGKERRTFPAYNPYSIEKCRTCPKGKIGLAAQDNELCRACMDLRKQLNDTKRNKANPTEVSQLSKTATNWAKNNLTLQTINGQSVYQNECKTSDGHLIKVRLGFFTETIAKCKRNPLLPEIMDAATHFDVWIKQSIHIRDEIGQHHNCMFSVYRANYGKYTIEFKCRNTSGEIIHCMNII